MLRAGQVPGWRSGERPDVLAWLRSGYAPDDGGQGGGDAGTGGDGQGSGGSAGAGGGGGGGADGQTGSDGQPFDAARAQRTIDALRSEIKALKGTAKERDDLAARLKAIEDKDKSDSERLAGDLKSATEKLSRAEQRAAEYEQRYTTALIRAAIDREAHRANAIDPDAVYALVDRSEISIDEAGTVVGADKAVAALLKAKTYLVKPDGDGGNGSGGNSGVKSTPTTPQPKAPAGGDDEAARRAAAAGYRAAW